MICQKNNQEKADVAIVRADKINFKAKQYYKR